MRPPHPRVRHPRILLTGDSFMQIVASYLGDGLRGRARVTTDIEPGAGVSKPGVDWMARARSQARRLHPRVTVAFIGGNEGFPMRTPAGTSVDCCGDPWVAEYARRERLMTRAWSRSGAGRVLWLALPAPRGRGRAAIAARVDVALRRAAMDLPGVDVLALDDILTPGFRYRDTFEVRGRTRRLHESDGAHLSAAAGSYVARLVRSELRRRGIL